MDKLATMTRFRLKIVDLSGSPVLTKGFGLLNLKTTIACVEGLMAGDIDRFQVKPLIMMLTHAGMKVHVEVVAA